MKNLETELAILEFSKKAPEEKYESILERATMELKELIISKDLRTMSLLKKEVEIRKNEQADPNALLILGARKRWKAERIRPFIETTTKNLKEAGASEETIIKILAEAIWPGKEETWTTLSVAKSLQHLDMLIESECKKIEIRANLRKERDQDIPKKYEAK